MHQNPENKKQQQQKMYQQKKKKLKIKKIKKKLQNIIPRNPLLIIYKSAPTRDITHHQPYDGSFCQKI